MHPIETWTNGNARTIFRDRAVGWQAVSSMPHFSAPWFLQPNFRAQHSGLIYDDTRLHLTLSRRYQFGNGNSPNCCRRDSIFV